jgi:hypothetical protein
VTGGKLLDKKNRKNTILLGMNEFGKDQKYNNKLARQYDGIGAVLNGDADIADKFVNSNIVDVTTGNLSRDLGKPYVVINRSGIRMGVIFTRKLQENDNTLYFMDPILSVIKLKRKMKKDKVNFVVLVSEIDSNCRSIDKGSFITPEVSCEEQDSLNVLVKRLPPGFVDIIVNRSDGFYFGKIKDLLVLQIPKGHNVVAEAKIYWSKRNKTFDRRRAVVFPPKFRDKGK